MKPDWTLGFSMRAHMCRTVVLLGTIFSAVALDAASRAANLDIDLALVLAFDVSGSVSPRRFDLQREGYAAAFASPQLIDAIRSTNHRAIAVTLVEWSGAYQQEQVIGWTLIEDEASSKAFGRAIAEVPRSFYGRTSISGAVDYCAGLFQQSGFADQRRVIDISGDGSNNDGSPVTDARDKAVAIGLTINGLPILSEESALGDYYQDNVIGGPGSFVLEVREFSHFADAVLRKLVREIADLFQNHWPPRSICDGYDRGLHCHRPSRRMICRPAPTSLRDTRLTKPAKPPPMAGRKQEVLQLRE